ncbi:DNA polymerase delta small subunit [Eumeta japonica]|uniref:DNA polymerase delta small subunit n=1 Tax=Eumeta variegata TaxID=151549 RepID=A0A4C1TMS9_EUMVA|nr:DNA polymerase delta small subunit [Eumeta japonica]
MLFKKESETENSEFEVRDVDRYSLEYLDKSERFYQVSRDFCKQYAHMYAARLNTFRNILSNIVMKRWSNKYKILKLSDIRERGSLCVIIGTLFKIQTLKPSILKELSDELEIIPQPARTHFVHETDSVVLEDEVQRIKLVGDCIEVHKIVTGVVCALLGSEDDDGIFEVKDICWPDCNIQKPLPHFSDDRYIVLISGLNMSSKVAEHWFSIDLFLEWLSGMSGNNYYQEQISKVVRVIVAGGIFNSSKNALNDGDVIASVEKVDSFCAAVSSVIPVDLMPGFKDPAGIMLPQKPFHYCLFPKATEYKSFNRVSNPYECDVGGFICLGTSGEPIKDIMRYSEIDNYLDAMKSTLKWRHLAPTAPDTVPCTPCLDTDPFTIYNCPALYFCGNTEEFATEMFKGNDNQMLHRVRPDGTCECRRRVTCAMDDAWWKSSRHRMSQETVTGRFPPCPAGGG